jgi:hypothetical protein
VANEIDSGGTPANEVNICDVGPPVMEVTLNPKPIKPIQTGPPGERSQVVRGHPANEGNTCGANPKP